MPNWLHKLFSSAAHAPAQEAASAALAQSDVAQQARTLKERGDNCLEQGDMAAATVCYRQAVALDPSYAKAHSNLGFALMEQGLAGEAEQCLRLALAHDDFNADTHFMLGNLLVMARGELDSGCEHLRRAVELRPFFEAAYLDWRRHMAQRGLLEQVGQFLADASVREPERADFHQYLGGLYREQQLFGEAEQAFRRALQLQPGNADLMANLGFSLSGQGKASQGIAVFEEAIAAFRQMNAAAPDDVDVALRLAKLLLGLNRLDDALKIYEGVLVHHPKRTDALLGRGWVELVTGNFAAGWLHFKDIAKQSLISHPGFAQPLWLQDADVAGKTVLLHADQGMGDALQFARYAERVAALGATVLLQVHAPLVPLLRSLSGVAQIFPEGADIPAFDFHCPLSNICLAFKTDLDSMPREFPYVHPPQEAIARWATRMAGVKLPRIGVVWSGNPLFRGDAERSIPLWKFSNLFSQPTCHFYLLQKDVRIGDRPFLPNQENVSNLEYELLDFSETAAAIALMDLVVTVDTSVAHLAGAMGKPVWILLPFAPDFRWLLERSDSPWYPSARLLRQPGVGDWGSVLEEVTRLLEVRFGKPN